MPVGRVMRITVPWPGSELTLMPPSYLFTKSPRKCQAQAHRAVVRGAERPEDLRALGRDAFSVVDDGTDVPRHRHRRQLQAARNRPSTHGVFVARSVPMSGHSVS